MNSAKRYITTLLIIVVASVVAWWSSHAESSVTNHVQKEVEKLVPRYLLNPTTIHSLVVDPVLEPILASSLQFAHKRAVEQHKSIVVVVKNGDADKYGDGSATHVATIRVNEETIAGLRIICSSETDPLHIAGVWTP